MLLCGWRSQCSARRFLGLCSYSRHTRTKLNLTGKGRWTGCFGKHRIHFYRTTYLQYNFFFTSYLTFLILLFFRWIGYLYMITSSLFLIALFLGWFLSAFSIRSNVDKNNKRNAVLFLIMVLFLNAALLVSIFAISISWSYHLELTGFDRATLACNMKNSQCTGCNDVVTENSCPEWSSEDIRSIMRRQLKQSATLAVIFLLYDLNVMIHGLHLRKHLIMYQIDYVWANVFNFCINVHIPA